MEWCYFESELSVEIRDREGGWDGDYVCILTKFLTLLSPYTGSLTNMFDYLCFLYLV